MKTIPNICAFLKMRWRIIGSALGLFLCTTTSALAFDVPATQAWTDTGIDVVAGQTLVIRAAGAVVYHLLDSNVLVNPNGVGGGGLDGTWLNPTAVLPNAISHTLIGKIGGTTEIGSGTPVPEGLPGHGPGFVGKSYAQVMSVSGRLFLGFNDSKTTFGDNSGSFAVTIARQLQIPSTQPWTDTGIDITSEQVLSIEATGTVIYHLLDPNVLVNANGVGGGGLDGTWMNANAVLPNAISHSLIGKIGGTTDIGTGTLVAEGMPQHGAGWVGSSYCRFAPATGRLFLGFNDSVGTFDDNANSFSVLIFSGIPEPVLHLKLDGNAVDSSPYSNHGLANGAMAYTTNAVSGSAGQFIPPENGYVEIPHSPQYVCTTGITVSFWFKPDGSQSIGRIIQKYLPGFNALPGTWEIAYGDTDKVWFYYCWGSSTGFEAVCPINISPTNWQHIAFTYSTNSNEFTAYVNGKAVVSQVPSHSVMPLDTTLSIMLMHDRHPEVPSHARGWLDDVRLYTRSLSPSEIQQLNDSDGDDLLDSWELMYFGNLTQNPGDDPDSDGWTNVEEMANNTPPNSFSIGPTSIFTAVQFEWRSATGHNYQVQRAMSPSGPWLDWGTPLPGTGTNMTVFDSTRSLGQKYYRVILAP